MSVELHEGGWIVLNCGEFHVVPVNDLRAHQQHNCWCNPEVDDDIICHNSMDQRELYEEGKLKPQ